MNTNLLAAAALTYALGLFIVAFAADRAARRGQIGWMRSPMIYTLSLSIYCTAWTFYGAVGFAARNGLEFVTIYLGPTLLMVGWWSLLRRLVRVGRAQSVTSIADLISSRFGKSNTLAVIVTLIAVVGTTPYIALQLQSIALSFAVFSPPGHTANPQRIAIWVAIGLSIFTILFGTRNLDASERHHGIVMAIAIEAIVKLIALLAVGGFVVWGLADGPADILRRIDASPIAYWQVSSHRWIGLTLLSAAAFICLPRMFQVLVVENQDEQHLRTAAWAFPVYVMLMSLFVLPIAAIGLQMMPPGANPDLYVLTLPLSSNQHGLAILAFIGGFSSATSMVVVATIALATMVSNQIIVPLWLRLSTTTAIVSGDMRSVALLSRRLTIAGVMLLGYLYFQISGGGAALASIGLIAFVGMVQFLPTLIGGLFWSRATQFGALAGLISGFTVWLYCLLLPSIGSSLELFGSIIDHGPLGLQWLRPTALFGVQGFDPVIHAFFWSMLFNGLSFVTVSSLTSPRPNEALQSRRFIGAQSERSEWADRGGRLGEAEDLLLMAQRIIGAQQAQNFFADAARAQGLEGSLPEPDIRFLNELERKLSGSVGTATAHAMVMQAAAGTAMPVEDLLAMANETVQMVEYSTQLEAKSEELARTARQLREANDKMQALSQQKDAFLSQVSHELRTPMTSIRAFSEILRDTDGLDQDIVRTHAGIIHDESIRLTRLLDDLLDFSVLESGQARLSIHSAELCDILDRAESAANVAQSALRIRRDRDREQITLTSDIDRLCQVFINLITNARKYCGADKPALTITVRKRAEQVLIDFVDNGSGIAPTDRVVIFEKFSRLDTSQSEGAGLGLAICREIMTRLDGTIDYLPGQQGAAFRVSLPLSLGTK